MKYILDLDASKVIEAVRSTGVTVTPAMMHYAHYLISNMKAIGTWSLCNAVYGFVGGTAASHKFNWKDLRDDDTAFRLVFNGKITHSANSGIQSDGSTGYANTFLSPASISGTGFCLSFYTNQNLALNSSEYVMGVSNSGTISTGTNNSLIVRRSNNLSIFLASGFISSPNNRVDATVLDSRGLTLGTTNGVSSKMFQKGIQIGSTTSFIPSTKDTTPIYLLTAPIDGGVSPISITNKPCQFATIGSGLTDTQSIQQSQIVTNAQNILNRA